MRLFEVNMTLKEFFNANPEAAVAFSGGADSAYLLWAAKKYGRKVKAYYVKSDFQPAFELKDAKRLAEELEVEIEIIKLDVLSCTDVSSNPSDRCYHCKKMIFTALIEAAERDGFKLVIDGTNASDNLSDRPGVRALRELSVRSPLLECGISKKQLRALSKEAGLFTHDKPAYACLATRIPTGEEITAEKISKTEAAESFLFSIGLSDFRVRYSGGLARLQLRSQDIAAVIENRGLIVKELKKYYSGLVLDLEVRNENRD